MENLEFPMTIAYNLDEKKVGCVLIQSALGATCPNRVISQYFPTEKWELMPSKCKLFFVGDIETLAKLIRLTA